MKTITKTIIVPLAPELKHRLLLDAALDEVSNLMQYASVHLPGYQHYEGEPIISRRGANKGQPTGKTLRVGIENIHASHVNDCAKGWARLNPDSVINASVRRDVVMKTHESFKSVSSNWTGHLWRSEPSALIRQYNLWGWTIEHLRSDFEEIHPGWWDENGNDFDNGKHIARTALGCKSITKQMIVTEIKDKKKPINHANRPRFGSMRSRRNRKTDPYPLPLHDSLIDYEEGVFHLCVSTGPGARLALPVQWRTKNPERAHYHRALGALGRGEGKIGGSKLVKKGDRYFIHLVINYKLVKQWDNSLPTVVAGIHGGIYRPLTVVVYDTDIFRPHRVDGRPLQYIHRGRAMINNWALADANQEKEQEKFDAGLKWRTRDEIQGDLDLRPWSWREKTFSRGRHRGKTLYRRRLSRNKISQRHRLASLFSSRKARMIHDEIHRATANVAERLSGIEANVLLLIHDWRYVRDTSNRPGSMARQFWDADDTNTRARRMSAMWPFEKYNNILEYKVCSLPNVWSHWVSPEGACILCSSCHGVGSHGNIQGEHRGSNYICGDCGRINNADINAARNLAWFGMKALDLWGPPPYKQADLEDLIRREVGVPLTDDEAGRKRAGRRARVNRIPGKRKWKNDLSQREMGSASEGSRE